MPLTIVAPGAAKRNPRYAVRIENASPGTDQRNSAQHPSRWAVTLCAISWATNAVSAVNADTPTIASDEKARVNPPPSRRPAPLRIRTKSNVRTAKATPICISSVRDTVIGRRGGGAVVHEYPDGKVRPAITPSLRPPGDRTVRRGWADATVFRRAGSEPGPLRRRAAVPGGKSTPHRPRRVLGRRELARPVPLGRSGGVLGAFSPR